MPENKYKRILLKLSGEALSGDKKSGIDTDTVDKICEQIKGQFDDYFFIESVHKKKQT